MHVRHMHEHIGCIILEAILTLFVTSSSLVI
jgi:hypothetical protein